MLDTLCPSTRSVPVPAFVTAAVNVPVPPNTSVPWLSSGMFRVPPVTVIVWPLAFVSVPVPLIVDVVNDKAVVAVVRPAGSVSVEPDVVSAPSVKGVVNVAVDVVTLSPPSVKAGVMVAVVPVRASVPAPPSVPLDTATVPPLMVKTRPAPIVIVPVVVKLGLVPDCVIVRSPVVSVMVPLFVITDDGRASVRPWLVVRLP